MTDKEELQRVVVRVLMAFHNRKAFTVAICKQLQSISSTRNFDIEIYAVDDGSTDGTSEELEGISCVIQIHKGDGTLFWARSMAIAEQIATTRPVGQGTLVLFMWLNDDVRIIEEAFDNSIDFAISNRGKIIIGPVRDESGKQTYGAYKRIGVNPLKLSHVNPSSLGETVDSFNGNFLIYDELVQCKVGPIDGNFSHGLADIDFGFRAQAAGVDLLQLPYFVGFCETNAPRQFPSRKLAWRNFLSEKGGGNFGSQRRILSKISRIWILYVLITYLLWWLRRILKRPPFFS